MNEWTNDSHMQPAPTPNDNPSLWDASATFMSFTRREVDRLLEWATIVSRATLTPSRDFAAEDLDDGIRTKLQAAREDEFPDGV